MTEKKMGALPFDFGQTGFIERELPDDLFGRFVVPPFTLLDTRQGYWKTRKKAWQSLGIEAELGREDVKLDNFGTGQTGLNAIVGGDFSAASIFDPVLCEVAYKWFCPPGGRVLDPFAGGAVRGIVAAKLGRKYFGVELSPRQVQANVRQRGKILNQEDNPLWLCGDSKYLLRVCDTERGYDFVFTCPPYGDLERYSDDPLDISTMPYEEFLQVYRFIMAQACYLVNDHRFLCVVVGDFRCKAGFHRNFVSDTITACQDAGMRLYNEAILINPAGTLPVRMSNQFNKSRKLGKCHQNVLVFYKGDPKKIRDNYPEEVEE